MKTGPFRLRHALAAALFSLGACGGGDPNEPGNNACAALNLPTKIINGTACTKLSESPVVRVILLSGRRRQGYCTGTLIAPRSVLTAGHCFINRPTHVEVWSGDLLAAATVVPAAGWDVHPGLRPAGGAIVLNDVAVIHLTGDLPLPKVPVLSSPAVAAGDIVSIFGYGTDETGQFDFEELKSGEMLITAVTDTHLQANYSGTGSNTCLGDSGGPLLINFHGVEVAAGVTSTGTDPDCLEGDRSYFTSLANPSVRAFLKKSAPQASFID